MITKDGIKNAWTNNNIAPTNEIVTLYHGSKSSIHGAIAPVSRKRCDFGKGFYMGTDRNQPLTLICNYPDARLYIAMADEICRKYSEEVMYWTGYTYRYWHYYTNEFSREIYKVADARTMNECWLGFHTLDIEMAIDDLEEIYKQRSKKRNSL